MAGNAPGNSGPKAPSPGVRIARPFGIPVFISPYWFLIAGLFVFLYAHNLTQAVPGNLRYLVAAAFVVLLYASVLVHELSHSVPPRDRVAAQEKENGDSHARCVRACLSW